MPPFTRKAACPRNAVHRPLHRHTLLERHEGRFASLIADLKQRGDTCVWRVGRYAWEECAANYAEDDELRDFLREAAATPNGD